LPDSIWEAEAFNFAKTRMVTHPKTSGYSPFAKVKVKEPLNLFDNPTYIASAPANVSGFAW